MDYFTALGELGLTEEELTRDRVRRTYLRRLREHPPERDPDGFKRLRSAFELLRNYASDDEPAATPPPVAVTPPFVAVTPPPVAVTPPPVAATPPVVELPPLAQPQTPEPLSALLPRLLTLLVDGDVKAAQAIDQKWRERADDVRHSGLSYDVARWALARELMGVAAELPPPVLRALAKALLRDDLTLAHDELSAFRLKDAKAAGDANVLLFTRANSIFKQIEGTLYLSTTFAAPFLPDINRVLEESRQRLRQPPPRRSGSGSTQMMVYGGLALVGLLLKIMVAGSSTTPSYQPYRPIQIPKLYVPPPIHPEMFFIPPPTPRLIYRDQSIPQLTQEVVDSSRVLQKFDITSPGQKQAAALVEEAAARSDCRNLRVALDELQLQPPHAVELRRLYAGMHIDAIKQRLERICAKKKRGK